MSRGRSKLDQTRPSRRRSGRSHPISPDLLSISPVLIRSKFAPNLVTHADPSTGRNCRTHPDFGQCIKGLNLHPLDAIVSRAKSGIHLMLCPSRPAFWGHCIFGCSIDAIDRLHPKNALPPSSAHSPNDPLFSPAPPASNGCLHGHP